MKEWQIGLMLLFGSAILLYFFYYEYKKAKQKKEENSVWLNISLSADLIFILIVGVGMFLAGIFQFFHGLFY